MNQWKHKAFFQGILSKTVIDFSPSKQAEIEYKI